MGFDQAEGSGSPSSRWRLSTRATSRRQTVADLEALGEAKFLQLPDAALERRHLGAGRLFRAENPAGDRRRHAGRAPYLTVTRTSRLTQQQ
jgi:hypothetical protein